MDKVAKHIKYENGKPVPKWIRCYEVKREKFNDPYTVVFTKASCWGGKSYLGMAACLGLTRSGSYYHDCIENSRFCPGGSKVKFYDLPAGVRVTVMREYEDCWGIKFNWNDRDAMIKEAQ